MIITENKLTNLINNTIGYNLSDRIIKISKFQDCLIHSCYRFRSKDGFNESLNQYGTMYCFSTPGNGNWLVQKREGGKWFIGHKNNVNDNPIKIEEYKLLSYMGLSMFGISLDYIIKHFVKEEDYEDYNHREQTNPSRH